LEGEKAAGAWCYNLFINRYLCNLWVIAAIKKTEKAVRIGQNIIKNRIVKVLPKWAFEVWG